MRPFPMFLNLTGRRMVICSGGDLAAVARRMRHKVAVRLAPGPRQNLWRWAFSGPVRGSKRESARLVKENIARAILPKVQPAPVALVGAGPGTRDLITLRGAQRLQDADVIFYDRLIDPDLLGLTRPGAKCVYVGKTPGCHSWPQHKINAFLVAAAKRGQRVVRLKCGDPGVFARGAEEAEALQAEGIDVEIVPGVTAASAAAAATGAFLTKRGRNDTLVLTTAHKADHNTPPDWVHLLASGARVAVYMGVSKAPDIVALLENAGIAHRTVVDIVSQAETRQQRTARCRALRLVEVIGDRNISNPAILFFSLSENSGRDPIPEASSAFFAKA